MKYLLPIFNLALAASLFFMVTDQMFVNAPLDEKPADKTASTGGIRALLARQTELNAAIIKAQELGARIDKLNGLYNNISQVEKDKLDLLLPDYVNNIQLIIDVNGIAKRNSMVIKNIKVITSEDKDTNNPSQNQLNSKNQALGTMLLSFSVTGPYTAYKNFLADLSSSLRIIDISSTSFATDDKGIYNYNIELRTYWLK